MICFPETLPTKSGSTPCAPSPTVTDQFAGDPIDSWASVHEEARRWIFGESRPDQKSAANPLGPPLTTLHSITLTFPSLWDNPISCQ